MVDVTHDGHDRRPWLKRFRAVGRSGRHHLSGIFLFANRLEPELRRDQFDLVEVEPLVHGDHHAHFLERELDNLGRRDLHSVGEFGYRDELVDPDPGLFAFLLLGAPGGQEVAITRFVEAPLPRAALHAGQRLQDVGLHLILIDVVLPALLALLPPALTLGRGVRSERPDRFTRGAGTEARTAGPSATRPGSAGRTAAGPVELAGPAGGPTPGTTRTPLTRRAAPRTARPRPLAGTGAPAGTAEHGAWTGRAALNPGRNERAARADCGRILPSEQGRLLADGREPRRNRRQHRPGGLGLFLDGFRFRLASRLDRFVGRPHGRILEQGPSPLIERRHRNRRRFDMLEQDRLLEVEDRRLRRDPIRLGLNGRLGLGDFGRRPPPLGRLGLRRHRRHRGRLGGRLSGPAFRLLRLIGLGRELPLLAFPPEPDCGYLGIIEWLKRAARRDVHILEQPHKLLARNAELRCQILDFRFDHSGLHRTLLTGAGEPDDPVRQRRIAHAHHHDGGLAQPGA